MNSAELALREAAASGGAPARAVAILDTWQIREREEFRQAMLSSDWRKIAALCPGITDPSQQFQHKILLHLMDATAPSLPSVPQEVERRSKDRRLNQIAEFTTERRLNDRRISQRRL